MSKGGNGYKAKALQGPNNLPPKNVQGLDGTYMEAGRAPERNFSMQLAAAAFREAVSLEDIRDIARKLVDLAKAGNIAAAQVVLDRKMGRVFDVPIEVDVQVKKTIVLEASPELGEAMNGGAAVLGSRTLLPPGTNKPLSETNGNGNGAH